MIIADFGSGNTCKNCNQYIKCMIDELAEVDKKRQIVIKWQLFKSAGKNIPLDKDCFQYAYTYARRLGFEVTASVFDIESLLYLLEFDIPFVKIANRPELYWLADEVPRKIKVVQSMTYAPPWYDDEYRDRYLLCCVSKYPANISDYIENNKKTFGASYCGDIALKWGISDHTCNWDLYKKYKPKVYEFHYKLEDSTGLDAGDFARTPKMIKEIL